MYAGIINYLALYTCYVCRGLIDEIECVDLYYKDLPGCRASMTWSTLHVCYDAT